MNKTSKDKAVERMIAKFERYFPNNSWQDVRPVGKRISKPSAVSDMVPSKDGNNLYRSVS